MRSVVALAVVVGCSSPSTGINNTTAGSAAPTEITGWIGIVPLPPVATSTSWMPVGDPAVVIHAPAEPVPREPLVVVTPDGTSPAKLRGAMKLPYGCDNNALDVLALDVQPRPSPGLTLVLPLPLPANWAPKEIQVFETERKKDRSWHAGPLWMTLAARDGTHATFSIKRDKVVYSVDVEKAYMAGDDHAPIDVYQDQPGLPTAIAAFELAPGGPELVVLRTPGHEGNAFSAVRIDGDRATLSKLGTYLYQCAF